MLLFYDIDRRILTARPGYAGKLSLIELKRGDAAVVDVRFVKADGAETQPAGTVTEMIFVVKSGFAEEDPPLIVASDFTLDEESGLWRAVPAADLEVLETLLGIASSISLMSEFTFTTSAEGPSSSQTVRCLVHNDLWKGSEVSPLPLPTPDDWLAARAVLYDRVQLLTEEEKLLVRTAIGAGTGDGGGGGFTPDATGLLAELEDYDAEAEGFTFLATDTGDLYFRQTTTPGVWSDPVPFGGEAGNSFAAIAVAGQASVPAGVPGATLNFAQGAGITLTTNAETKTVTVALTPPYVPPTFSAFAITGYSHNQIFEVGSVLPSPLTFTWGTTTPENIPANTIGISLVSPATTLLSGSANDGTQSVAVGAPVTTAFTAANKVFRITGNQTTGDPITRDFTLQGIQPWFWGKVTSGSRPTIDAAAIAAGTKVLAASTGTLTIPFASGAGDFVWFATPAASTTKAAWAETGNPFNAGAIGGSVSPGGNLFPAHTTVSVTTVLWAGVSYKLYVANYPVAIASLQVSN